MDTHVPFFSNSIVVTHSEQIVMEDTFEKLMKLTGELPAIPKVEDIKQLVVPGSESHVEYPIEGGHCFSVSLFSSPEISVARTFVSAGGILPDHKHDEKEIAIVYSGAVMVRSNDDQDQDQKIIRTGGFIVYNPGVIHYARALEDTWFVAMTIPHSNDYPQ